MKLNYKRTFFVGLAFLSISAFWQMYDNIIPLILENTFHLNDAVIGGIMAMDNVLAVFLLPIIGTLSDKVDTRLGKRTPFIIGGTIAAVTFMLLMPLADKLQLLGLFVIALALTLLAMAMYRSPAVALMPDLTPKPLRSKANAVINLMGAIGGVYTLLVIKLLVKKVEIPSYLPVFVGVAAMMILAIVLLLITTKEKKIAAQIALEYPEEAEEEQKKQINLVMSLINDIKDIAGELLQCFYVLGERTSENYSVKSLSDELYRNEIKLVENDIDIINKKYQTNYSIKDINTNAIRDRFIANGKTR